MILVYFQLLVASVPFVFAQDTVPFSKDEETLGAIQTVALDLSSALNIKAAAVGPSDPTADFDGSGRSYPVEHLPTASSFDYNGIKVTSSVCSTQQTNLDILILSVVYVASVSYAWDL